MTFPLEDIRRLGKVVRVVVADTKGSVPREVGASMLVHCTGVEGTIGGGALEFEAIVRARDVLADGADQITRVPLGPGVGQCCGGAVTLLTEVWDETRLIGVSDIVARPLPDSAGAQPLAVTRIKAAARNAGTLPKPGVIDGWMVEPVTHPTREIWVWGAGHVGRAVVGALAPLPGVKIVWADCDHMRFPEDIPVGADVLVAANPADLVTLSPIHAEHLVLTYSHALDLELCHRLLARGFRTMGLIGSATKWARFRSRLAVLGHKPEQIARIACPIGDPILGKHPQQIALGVATDILRAGFEGDETVGKQA